MPETCREPSIGSAPFYKRHAKYGGMDVSMMARLKELEAENARLRKTYVEEKLRAVGRRHSLLDHKSTRLHGRDQAFGNVASTSFTQYVAPTGSSASLKS